MYAGEFVLFCLLKEASPASFSAGIPASRPPTAGRL